METGVIVTTASMGKVVVSGDSDWPASISGVSLATSVCRHKIKRKAVNNLIIINIIIIIYYSTIMSFYHIRSREQANTRP